MTVFQYTRIESSHLKNIRERLSVDLVLNTASLYIKKGLVVFTTRLAQSLPDLLEAQWRET